MARMEGGDGFRHLLQERQLPLWIARAQFRVGDRVETSAQEGGQIFEVFRFHLKESEQGVTAESTPFRGLAWQPGAVELHPCLRGGLSLRCGRPTMSEPPEDIEPAETMRRELADLLADLEVWRMPFGRFKHARLHTLPYEYLHWFVEKGDGFPKGRLGELMEFVYRTKGDGAEVIFSRLRKGGR